MFEWILRECNLPHDDSDPAYCARCGIRTDVTVPYRNYVLAGHPDGCMLLAYDGPPWYISHGRECGWRKTMVWENISPGRRDDAHVGELTNTDNSPPA